MFTGASNVSAPDHRIPVTRTAANFPGPRLFHDELAVIATIHASVIIHQSFRQRRLGSSLEQAMSFI